MGTPCAVSAAGAAGFLADAQHLTGSRGAAPGGAATPAAVLREIRHLECVQIDPVAVVERNQHLVLAARVPGYAPDRLVELLHRGRALRVLGQRRLRHPDRGFSDLRGDAAVVSPAPRARDRGAADRSCAASSPRWRTVASPGRRVPSRLPERVRGHWGAEAKATSHALSLLFRAGRLVVARRDGAERHFALAEHVIPEDAPGARAGPHDGGRQRRAVREVRAGVPRLRRARSAARVGSGARRRQAEGARAAGPGRGDCPAQDRWGRAPVLRARAGPRRVETPRRGGAGRRRPGRGWCASSRRSTICSGGASGSATCSASSTGGRDTRRPRSAGTATTRCRSCAARG